MTKHKNTNSDKTQKEKLGQNSKIQTDKTKKNQTVTKLNNSNCDKTQKHKL